MYVICREEYLYNYQRQYEDNLRQRQQEDVQLPSKGDKKNTSRMCVVM